MKKKNQKNEKLRFKKNNMNIATTFDDYFLEILPSLKV